MRSFDRDSFYKSPGAPFRVNDELRHNPYVGSFHGVSRITDEMKNRALSIHNPHLGTFRHSPAIATVPLKPALNVGLKGLLYDDSPWKKTVFSQLQVGCCARNAKLHLTPLILNTIPVTIFSIPPMLRSNPESIESFAHEDNNPVCAICLECFTDGCELRNLACQHCFHKKCADMWLSGQHSEEGIMTAICPTCRQDAIIISPPFVSQPSSEADETSLSPLLLTQISNEDDEGSISSIDELDQKRIDEVIDNILEGRGVQLDDSLNAFEKKAVHIPDTAYVNMGKFLFSAFYNTSTTPRSNGQSIANSPKCKSFSLFANDVHVASPSPDHLNDVTTTETMDMSEDPSMLGSSYAMCNMTIAK